MIQPLWKMVWRFLRKLEIKPPYDPAISFLGIYPEEAKTEKDTCSLQHCLQKLEHGSNQDVHGQIKKLWYIYTAEYYSATKGTHLSQL